MAGLGRRTHYRKHLTDQVLYDLPEPTEHERIAKVCATRGSNQFDVRLATSVTTTTFAKAEEDATTKAAAAATSTNDGGGGPAPATNTVLAILPTKFRKLVWVKRNDFVIVQTVSSSSETKNHIDTSEDTAENGNDPDDDSKKGIRYMITHILYKDQIQHLKSKQLWPTHDPEFNSISTTNNHHDHPSIGNDADRNGKDENEEEGITGQEDDDGIMYYDENGYSEDYEDPLLFVNTNQVSKLAIQDSSSSSSDEEE